MWLGTWLGSWFGSWFGMGGSPGDATASASFATITLTAPTATATAVNPEPPVSVSYGGSTSQSIVSPSYRPRTTLGELAAALQTKLYTSTQELADDFIRGLTGLSRQPSLDRGLRNDIITDIQGGTTLGVGDTGAANDSDGLVQNPQPGIPMDVGSGLRTRRQARVESRTRTLPATVVTNAEAGDTTVRVRIASTGTTKGQDSLTKIETVGNLDMAEGVEYDAAMTGQPIVIEGGNGIQPIEAGRTVQVVLTENYEVATTHTVRQRKNIPVVTRVLKSTSAALVNGFACKGTVCVPNQEFAPTFTLITPDTGAADWDMTTVFDAEVGRAWGVLILPADYPSGTIDMFTYGYYAYGVVPPGGVLPFTGIAQAVADANSQWTNQSPALLNTPYIYALLIGCNQGQVVGYGSISSTGDQPGFPARDWVITDSNFPDPL